MCLYALLSGKTLKRSTQYSMVSTRSTTFTQLQKSIAEPVVPCSSFLHCYTYMHIQPILCDCYNIISRFRSKLAVCEICFFSRSEQNSAVLGLFQYCASLPSIPCIAACLSLFAVESPMWAVHDVMPIWWSYFFALQFVANLQQNGKRSSTDGMPLAAGPHNGGGQVGTLK